MAKKVSLCQECGRTVYTNDIDLCKRCYNEVGLDILDQQEEIEELPEEEPSMEDLGIEVSEETAEEDKKEPKEEAEKVKEQ